MAQQRKGWSSLSPDYRKRLERQGVTARNYKTADLRGARGHRPSPPSSAAPRTSLELALGHEATDRSRSTLEQWREDMAPGWLPNDPSMLDTDTAAALSQLPSPRTWGDVHFTPRGGGEPWTMEVEIKGGYPRTIEIPGGTDAADVLKLLSSPDFFDMDDYEDWEVWYENEYDFDVGPSA